MFLFFSADGGAVAIPWSEPERRRFGCSQSELDQPLCGRIGYPQPKRHQSIGRRIPNPSAERYFFEAG